MDDLAGLSGEDQREETRNKPRHLIEQAQRADAESARRLCANAALGGSESEGLAPECIRAAGASTGFAAHVGPKARGACRGLLAFADENARRSRVALRVFGYGSLVWRPALPYSRWAWARLPGWQRRFYQGSPDHRGTPQRPGRVATLLPDQAAACWGIMYEVAPERAQSVAQQLDVREKGGYARHWVTVETAEAGVIEDVLLYVATPDNPHYLGPAPLAQMVAQIRSSRGESGTNAEYVLRLADALSRRGIEDGHVQQIAAAVSRG